MPMAHAPYAAAPVVAMEPPPPAAPAPPPPGGPTPLLLTKKKPLAISLKVRRMGGLCCCGCLRPVIEGESV
jgi:hypothetical protein